MNSPSTVLALEQCSWFCLSESPSTKFYVRTKCVGLFEVAVYNKHVSTYVCGEGVGDCLFVCVLCVCVHVYVCVCLSGVFCL